MVERKRIGIQRAMDEYIENLSEEEKDILQANVERIDQEGGDIINALTPEQLRVIEMRADFIDYTGLTFEEAMIVSNSESSFSVSTMPKEYFYKMMEMSTVNEEEYDYGHCPLCIDWETGERYCHCKLCHPEDPYWPGGDYQLISEAYDKGEFDFLVSCCLEHDRMETEGPEYCYREKTEEDIAKYLETFGDPKLKSKEYFLAKLNQYPPKNMYYTDKRNEENSKT